MPLRNSWRRALVFSGLVDDQPPAHPDYLQPPFPEPADQPDGPPLPTPGAPPTWQTARPEHPLDPPGTGDHDDDHRIVVRRLTSVLEEPVPRAPSSPAPPPPDAIADVFGRDEPAAPPIPPSPRAASPPPAAPRLSPSPSPPATQQQQQREVSVLRVAPRSFNDAQLVADRFKASCPVVLDMQGVDTDLAKRLIGFASGLTYGLDGAMERLDDRVFLLTPRGVEVPPAQRARLAAQGSLSRV